MTKIRFIGDVHGLIAQYLFLVDDCDYSIQVGDFGAGFVDLPKMDEKHRFIRGNHDNPNICKETSFWIPDGTIENGIMFVGGAESIDKIMRIEGESWWPDEELSLSELYKIYDIYAQNKPRIMVTHDCPQSVARTLFPWMIGGEFEVSRTRQAFDSMFEIHKPEIWIFGHWHMDKNQTILGTRFVCLNELSYIDLNI